MLAILLTFWTDVPVWLFGDAYQLNATSSAFIGLSILLVTGVLAWQDVLAEKSPWNTRVWFVSNYATLGMVAGRFYHECCQPDRLGDRRRRHTASFSQNISRPPGLFTQPAQISSKRLLHILIIE